MSSNRRILLVDDEPSIREVLGAVLRSQGYQVLTAEDGVDALTLLEEPLPSVIISDLRMPRMSGFELLAIVRKRFPQIPVIAISGEFLGGDLPTGVLADAFLQKGAYRVEKLFTLLTQLTANSPIRAPQTRVEIAPVWVPKDVAGSVMVTCTKCLRSFDLCVRNMNGGIHVASCPSCTTPVKFLIDHRTESILKSDAAA